MELFEQKDVITEAVERTKKLLARFRRGQVCPWEALEEAAGFDRNSPHWSAYRARLIRDFRHETGIELDPVYGVGWKLPTVVEQMHDLVMKRERRAVRQAFRAIKVLKAIPDKEMTQHQRESRAVRLSIAREAHRRMKLGSRRVSMLGQPTSSGLPQRRAASVGT